MRRRDFIGVAGLALAAPALTLAKEAGRPALPENYVHSPRELFTEVQLKPGEAPEFPLNHLRLSWEDWTYQSPYCVTFAHEEKPTRTSIMLHGDYVIVPTWELMHTGTTLKEAVSKNEQRLDAVLGDFLRDLCYFNHYGDVPQAPHSEAERMIYRRLMRHSGGHPYTKTFKVKYWEHNGHLYGANVGRTDSQVLITRMIHHVHSLWVGELTKKPHECHRHVTELGIASLLPETVAAVRLV